jgi:hypothetical protein
MMGTDELRAWYGPDHVALAVDRGAVGTLLISDELFRSTDPVKRRKYVDMVEAVRSKGGEALIFSSMHESGQRELDDMSCGCDTPQLMPMYDDHLFGRTQSRDWYRSYTYLPIGRRNRGDGGARGEREARRVEKGA